jgi:hypothetical protein
VEKEGRNCVEKFFQHVKWIHLDKLLSRAVNFRLRQILEVGGEVK